MLEVKVELLKEEIRLVQIWVRRVACPPGPIMFDHLPSRCKRTSYRVSAPTLTQAYSLYSALQSTPPNPFFYSPFFSFFHHPHFHSPSDTAFVPKASFSRGQDLLHT